MTIRTIPVAEAMKVLTSGDVARALQGVSENKLKEFVEHLASIDHFAAIESGLVLSQLQSIELRACGEAHYFAQAEAEACHKDLQELTRPRIQDDYDRCNNPLFKASDDFIICLAKAHANYEKHYREEILPKVGGSDDAGSISLYDLEQSEEGLSFSLTKIQRHVIIGALAISMAKDEKKSSPAASNSPPK